MAGTKHLDRRKLAYRNPTQFGDVEFQAHAAYLTVTGGEHSGFICEGAEIWRKLWYWASQPCLRLLDVVIRLATGLHQVRPLVRVRQLFLTVISLPVLRWVPQSGQRPTATPSIWASLSGADLSQAGVNLAPALTCRVAMAARPQRAVRSTAIPDTTDLATVRAFGACGFFCSAHADSLKGPSHHV